MALVDTEETIQSINRNTQASAASLERSKKLLAQIFQLQDEIGQSKILSNDVPTTSDIESQPPKQT